MSVTISDARARLAELVLQVEDGGEVVLTRHGQPVAVLIHPTALRARRAQLTLDDAEALGVRLAEAKKAGAVTRRVTRERADELVAHIDRSRDD